MIETLKIYKKLKEICNSVKNNSVTIVTTPTGSGKTLAVPITLSHVFDKKVYVTVPRVFLAKSAMNSVVKLILGESLSHKVGCITGKYNQNTDANLVFCTERSFLNRIKLQKDKILVIDEIHEQGINTEEVIYFAKTHIKNGGKVVLMSATMDTSKYIKYLGEGEIIELPETERQFSTEIIKCSSYNYLDKVIELGEISLIGVAGKEDIEAVKRQLQEKKYLNPIYSFHGETEVEEENAMLHSLSIGEECIVIATSVAMSGVTLDNLSNVVVPIYGKRIENGILKEYVLSVAEAKQWAGRVGRTSNGNIIEVYNNANREVNPLPEILRIDIIDVVLSFIGHGVDLRTIELLNQPSNENIEKSYFILEKSGIIENNTLTEKGKFIVQLGEGLTTGSLIYEGRRLGIENTARKIATLIQNGNPFRKLIYSGKYNPLFEFSEHMKIIEWVQSEEMDYRFNPSLKELAKEKNIYLKGVSNLRKSFNKIDNTLFDNVELTPALLKEMFSKQLVTNLFQYGNNHSGRVVANKYDENMYCTLTPIKLKSGQLVEMTTII